MKRMITVILIGALLTMSLVSPALAGGDKSTISFGIGLLTGAILGVAAATPHPVVVSPVGSPAIVYAPSPHQWIPAHWQDQWVPTTTQLQIWIPGHHDAYGYWTPGHYQAQVIQSGAWTRVWVTGHWE